MQFGREAEPCLARLACQMRRWIGPLVGARRLRRRPDRALAGVALSRRRRGCSGGGPGMRASFPTFQPRTENLPRSLRGCPLSKVNSNAHCPPRACCIWALDPNQWPRQPGTPFFLLQYQGEDDMPDSVYDFADRE